MPRSLLLPCPKPPNPSEMTRQRRRLAADKLRRDRHRIQALHAEGKRLIALEWESVPIFEFRSLPDSSGVYVVFAGEAALYVGQSRSILNRWKDGHHIAIDAIAKGADRIAWMEVGLRHLDKAERALYSALRPLLNAAPLS